MKEKIRFVVRKEVTKELEEKGLLVKTEVTLNKVGTSERTKAVIEPSLVRSVVFENGRFSKTSH